MKELLLSQLPSLYIFVGGVIILILLTAFMPAITIRCENLGANAKNSLFLIRMRKKVNGVYHTIWAQEKYELEHKRASFKNFFAYAFNKEFRQEIEIMGHEIEVQVAVQWGEDEARYRANEAFAISTYKQFKGVSVENITRRLEAASIDAQRWIEGNKDEIAKHEKYS